MQYVNQTSYEDPAARERGRKDTVATAGCGLCCSIMVADRLRVLDGGYEVEDARQLSYDVGANQWTGTKGSVFFPAFAEKLGLQYVQGKTPEDLLRCLRSGGAAIVQCGGDREGYHGVFSDRWGHYIVAIAEEPDGRIAVLDPAYEEGNYEKGDRKGKVEVLSRGFGRTSIQVLQEETFGKETPYHLFWRK